MKKLMLAMVVALGVNAQVKYEDIVKGPGKDWLTYAGDYQALGLSSLDQVTPENAANMTAKWSYTVPGASGLRTRPIVHDGVMYFTNSNEVYALDARSGRLIWKYTDLKAQKKDAANRGAAILGDKIYFSTVDVHLVALDRRTGGLIWRKQYGDIKKGEFASSAPLAINGLIIVGNGGGDLGMRGAVTALDAETGEQKWKTYTVPAKGEKGAETWGEYVEWGGGATNWMSQSYNPATGLLAVVTLEQCDVYTSSEQKPEPMKSFAGGGAGPKPKDAGQFFLRAFNPLTGQKVWEYPMTGKGNMWAGAVGTKTGVIFVGDDDGHLVAVDGKTGKHLWHYQTGDDVYASPIIYSADGKQYVAIASSKAIFSFGLFEPVKSVPVPAIKIQ